MADASFEIGPEQPSLLKTTAPQTNIVDAKKKWLTHSPNAANIGRSSVWLGSKANAKHAPTRDTAKRFLMSVFERTELFIIKDTNNVFVSGREVTVRENPTAVNAEMVHFTHLHWRTLP